LEYWKVVILGKYQNINTEIGIVFANVSKDCPLAGNLIDG